MVGDDETDQAVTKDAFEVLRFIAGKRLALGKLTVIDATNVQPEARKPLVELARQYHCLPVAIVLDLPERVCLERNVGRPDRGFGPHVVRNQKAQLRRSFRGLRKEGFRHLFAMVTPEEVEAAVVERVPLWNDKRDEHGPFDIIGDVHGCCDELEELLGRLGYVESCLDYDDPHWGNRAFVHPEGRKAVFVGDLVDRGPRILDAVKLVRNMVYLGSALCVPGNHDMKLMRALRGSHVQVTHGLADTLAELDAIPGVNGGIFRSELAGLPRRPGEPLRPRRRQARGGPRRDEGRDAGPGLGTGARLRALRRDDRRDRRVRPARPLRLGQGISRAGDGRLRPYAGPRAGVAQPHRQHRHRLRLRRQADRPALPREGVRLGPRRPDLLRAGPAVPAFRGARSRPCRRSRRTTRCSTPRTCWASGSSRPGCGAT